MNPKSLAKIHSAGFTIIRRYDHWKMIKILKPQKSTVIPSKDKNFIRDDLSWQNLEGPFESKAAMNRRMEQLLEDQKTVEA